MYTHTCSVSLFLFFKIYFSVTCSSYIMKMRGRVGYQPSRSSNRKVISMIIMCVCGCVSTVYDVYFLAVQSVTLSQFELQDLLSRQKVHVSLLIIANNSNNNDTRTSFVKFHVKFHFESRKRKEIAFTKKNNYFPMHVLLFCGYFYFNFYYIFKIIFLLFI